MTKLQGVLAVGYDNPCIRRLVEKVAHMRFFYCMDVKTTPDMGQEGLRNISNTQHNFLIIVIDLLAAFLAVF